MPKLKDKRKENYSVASEIDRLEVRRAQCQENLEQAEFKHRRDELSEEQRQDLELEMSFMNERVHKLDQELQVLRGENRRNMVLSVALLAVSALFYYVFIYSEDQS
ncbi:unnamed protein product [Knipowitschia caucasica]|uniref:Coiled-coil domain-containing protein 167 n=1 Tax=Knipowitschia caucasica TaxID=637954 RepID=A0AAV2KBS2_KNICA